MRTTKSTDAKNSKSGGGEYTTSFVRCELSDADREFCRENVMSELAVLETVEALTIAGIKVTFSYEQQNDCMAVYATGTDRAAKEFKSRTLTGRGPDLLSAVTVLAYKNERLLHNDWSAVQKAGEEAKWG